LLEGAGVGFPGSHVTKKRVLNMQNVRDASMRVSIALPNGESVSEGTTSIDVGLGHAADGVEFLLSTPALTTSQISDGKTIKVDVAWSASANLSSPEDYISAAITLTGAGGAGCAAKEFRFRIPSTAKRYLFLRATGSAAGNANVASATLEALF
jgi:hypothetical protein